MIDRQDSERRYCDFGDIDDKTLLKEINRAIRTILFGGQSYRIGNQEVRRADLNDLRKMKNELAAAADADEDASAGLGRRSAAAYFDRR